MPQPAETSWFRRLNPRLPDRLGRLRRVLFDFDGTLSVLREGWEAVMIPLMLRSICGAGPVPAEIDQEVRAYVDRSTGILTIKQMQWLAEAVARYGLLEAPRSAAAYKAEYIQELLAHIEARKRGLLEGVLRAEDLLLAGAPAFLAGLARRGVPLYLASGTDHIYVAEEARCLGLAAYFDGKIYGALDHSEANDKEQVIRQLLAEEHLSGDELLVVGDGPVEIRIAHEYGALALGVASDEIARSGWNERKVARLAAAGADLLVADFSRAEELLVLLFGE